MELWRDENRAFLVDIPDLPGCKADRTTVVVEAVIDAPEE